MISITITGTLPTISTEKFLREFKRINKEVIKKSAGRFFIVAAEKIPVWSGEAVGSLLLGAAAVGEHIAIKTEPGVKSRKSIGMNQGDFKWVDTRYITKFNFKSTVRHLSLLDNETVDGPPPNKPSPWGAFKAGRLAALEYLKKNAKLPATKTYIVNKRYFRR